jgi:hypothetical protein
VLNQDNCVLSIIQYSIVDHGFLKFPRSPCAPELRGKRRPRTPVVSARVYSRRRVRVSGISTSDFNYAMGVTREDRI